MQYDNRAVLVKNRFFTFVFLPTVILCAIAFWARGIILLDPDFGWHLRMGELILEKGIPKTDPFSYTMPSYPFVDHEWFTDVALFKLYPILQEEGLAAIFSILATFSLVIQVQSPIRKWFFVPFLLAAGALLGFVGIRPQVISWVFFSILLVVLFHPKVGKWRFALPFLFLVWANLHGGFGMGIAVLLVVTAVRMWEKKKILLEDAIILLLCFIFTLINPYGIHLWRELWMSISDTSLRFSIAEWKPGLFTFSFSLWSFVALSTMSVLKYRKRFAFSQLFPYFILLMAGASSIRHIPFWLLLAFPMTANAIAFFAEEMKHYKGATERLNKAYFFFAIGVIFVVVVEAVLNLRGVKSIREESFYPKQAVEFVSANKSCGQLFSTYGWGGYLIWKLPEKKVFIDGRMPSWRWEANLPSESNYAFEESNKILAGKIPVGRAIDKYNIDTFLLPVEKKKETLPILEDLQKKLEKLLNRESYSYGEFIKQLQENGMGEVYKDETAVVYRDKNYQLQCDEI